MTNPNFDMGLVRTVKAAVVRRGLQGVFANRLERVKKEAQRIIIASPWVTYHDMEKSPLIKITRIMKEKYIPTYIFTRPPENFAETQALKVLESCPSAEIIFNPNLHAKLYVCIAPYPYGFALLGSANFTVKSEDLYEIGMIVLAEGGGEEIVKQLASFGLDYLRTRSDSVVIKKLSLRRQIYETR